MFLPSSPSGAAAAADGVTVPGTEMMPRVFYTAVTQITIESTRQPPPGCTFKETQQGLYVVDHVRRIAYPLALCPLYVGDGQEGWVRASANATAAAAATPGNGGGGAILTDDARVAELMLQIEVRDQIIASVEQKLEDRKFEVQTLQRKLRAVNSAGGGSAPAQPLLRSSSSAGSMGAAASHPLTDALSAAHISSVASTTSAGRAAPAAPVAPATQSEAPAKQPVPRATPPEIHSNPRAVRYGDERIGVDYSDDDSDSDSDSSSYTSSSFSSMLSGHSQEKRQRGHRANLVPVGRPAAKAPETTAPKPPSPPSQQQQQQQQQPVTMKRPRDDDEDPTAPPPPAPPSQQSQQSQQQSQLDRFKADVLKATPSTGSLTSVGSRGEAAQPPQQQQQKVAAVEANDARLLHSTALDTDGALNASAVPPTAMLPVGIADRERSALLFCHLCRVFFPPHPANIRQHFLSSAHQKVGRQIDAYLERENANRGGTGSNQAPLTRMDVMQERGDVFTQTAATRMQFGKLWQDMPPYIGPRSIATDEEKQQAERNFGNTFFNEGLDVVLPICNVCNVPIATQSYKMHEATLAHRTNVINSKR